MKALFTFTFVFFSIFSFSQQIIFSVESIDLGTINEVDGKKECSFDFKNAGKENLIISKVQVSCGCTTVEYPQNAVEKKGKGSIKVVFDPSNRPGDFSKTITVFSNSLTNPRIILTISGNVNPKPQTLEEVYKLKLGPLNTNKDRINFNKIPNSKLSYDTLLVYNSTDSVLSISFNNVPEHISLKAEPQTLAPGKIGQVFVNFDPSKTPDFGYKRDIVYIDFNGRKEYNYRIFINAEIIEDFSIMTEEEKANASHIEFESSVFVFDTLVQGESVSTKFRFKNTGKSDLIIRKVSASCGCTAPKPEKNVIAAGETSEINVTFNSGTKQGAQNKTITVICNDPLMPEKILYLKGYIAVPKKVVPKEE